MMTMTQRYAGMLRRHAGEWDKQGMPVQAEATRQAARHMEEVQAALERVAVLEAALRRASMAIDSMKNEAETGLVGDEIMLRDGCEQISARGLDAYTDARAALTNQTAPAPGLTEDEIEDCIDSAHAKFKNRAGVTGQQITWRDSLNHWLAREVIAAHEAKVRG